MGRQEAGRLSSWRVTVVCGVEAGEGVGCRGGRVEVLHPARERQGRNDGGGVVADKTS